VQGMTAADSKRFKLRRTDSRMTLHALSLTGVAQYPLVLQSLRGTSNHGICPFSKPVM
jgi:hypothetical protein